MSWMIPGDIPEGNGGCECEEATRRRTWLVVKLIVAVGVVILTAVLLDWVALLPNV
ncbi:MAG: hypothetical protein JW955_07595 [Sedimentisphaerales bacterium]|nr:hypothetical protein [Sedimentisphaerales bacterium]